MFGEKGVWGYFRRQDVVIWREGVLSDVKRGRVWTWCGVMLRVEGL